jgi:hypothetical protein
MNTKDKAEASAPSQDEPSNVLIETLGNRIKVRKAIVSGRPNFGITKKEADALVALGVARIVGTL